MDTDAPTDAAELKAMRDVEDVAEHLTNYCCQHTIGPFQGMLALAMAQRAILQVVRDNVGDEQAIEWGLRLAVLLSRAEVRVEGVEVMSPNTLKPKGTH